MYVYFGEKTHLSVTTSLLFCCIICYLLWITGFPGDSDGKQSACNAGNPGWTIGSGRFHGEGNGNPLQYSCLENPMDGGAWCRLLSMGSQRVGHDSATSLSLLLSKSTGVSWLPVFLASSLEYTRQQQQQKNTLETHCWVIPLGPEALSPVYPFIIYF